MRREWADTVQYRRWDEFERLAKWEPDQELCDTIAKLERESTEKADRKALKKVLWILEKAGFHATPLEEQEADQKSSTPLQVAFMMSSDAVGDTPITYGAQAGSKFRWLTVYVHETRGVTRASTDTMSLEEGQKRMEALRKAEAPPYFSGEIDPEYALWRIKRALEKNRTRTIPEAIAYWRSAIDKAVEKPHPAKALKASKTKPAERAEDVLLMDCTLSWRIELGAATPILEKMYEAQTQNKEADEEAQKAAVKDAGVEARRMVLTPDLVAEHVMRLRDLAYLMHTKGDANEGKVLSAADELEKKGADSEYAKGLVDKTVVIYVETLRKSDQQAQQQ